MGERAGYGYAVFAAGCFWGVEAAFRRVPGVVDVEAGYSGGGSIDPSYHEVCTGRTGHAEVVRVCYDPGRTDYATLLATFWNCHDPTTVNRQGADVGSQYRSAIFTLDDSQQASALASREQVARRLSRPVVTEIRPAGPFWRAEDDHQNRLAGRGWHTGE